MEGTSNNEYRSFDRNHCSQCFYCQMYPCIKVLRLICIDIFQPCIKHYKRQTSLCNLFQLYQICNLLVTYIGSISITIIFIFGVEYTKFVGSGLVFLYGDNVNVTFLILLLFQFYYTIVVTWLYWYSRHKIELPQIVGTHQEFPSEITQVIDVAVVFSFSIHLMLSLTFAIASGINIYKLLQDAHKVARIILTISFTQYVILAWAKLIYGLTVFLIGLTSYILHLQSIRKCLQNQERIQLSSYTLLMIQRKLFAMCENLQLINDDCGWMFLLSYLSFLGLICFHFYLFVYANATLAMRIHMICLVVVYLIQFILTSFAAGEICSLSRNCLYDLWKFDMNKFSLRKRLHILTLMKRYSGSPAGVRIWNCFTIKRMFVYRGLSSLSSLFTTLQKVHQITRKRSCVSQIQNEAFNNTSYSEQLQDYK